MEWVQYADGNVLGGVELVVQVYVGYHLVLHGCAGIKILALLMLIKGRNIHIAAAGYGIAVTLSLFKSDECFCGTIAAAVKVIHVYRVRVVEGITVQGQLCFGRNGIIHQCGHLHLKL